MSETSLTVNTLTPAPEATGLEARVGDYVALMKPRVMSLVVFTALAGLAAAPGSIHPVLGAAAILCIAIGAGAAGALNMWFDADIDACMRRTAGRPIPAGRVPRGDALAFGITLGAGAVAAMGLWTNWLAAALLALTILFYLVIYTMWLKRRTPQNIVIGGAAGAFPPMIGWTAVTGGIDWGALALFAIIFVWTPPHFWALALYRSADYAKAGIPMMPVVAGDAATRRQIFGYSLLLAPLAFAPVVLGVAGALYGFTAILTGIAFLALAWRVWCTNHMADPTEQAARRLFAFSVLYLFLLFAALLAEAGLGASLPLTMV